MKHFNKKLLIILSAMALGTASMSTMNAMQVPTNIDANIQALHTKNEVILKEIRLVFSPKEDISQRDRMLTQQIERIMNQLAPANPNRIHAQPSRPYHYPRGVVLQTGPSRSEVGNFMAAKMCYLRYTSQIENFFSFLYNAQENTPNFNTLSIDNKRGFYRTVFSEIARSWYSTGRVCAPLQKQDFTTAITLGSNYLASL